MAFFRLECSRAMHCSCQINAVPDLASPRIANEHVITNDRLSISADGWPAGFYRSNAFGLLNLKNDSLRKRFDSIKYDVKRLEEGSSCASPLLGHAAYAWLP